MTTLQEQGPFFKMGAVETVREYISYFEHDMTTAELIGAYRKLVDLGEATDAEECALLELLAPVWVNLS